MNGGCLPDADPGIRTPPQLGIVEAAAGGPGAATHKVSRSSMGQSVVGTISCWGHSGQSHLGGPHLSIEKERQ